MRADTSFVYLEALCEAATRLLNRLMFSLLPCDKRGWGEALISEQQQIKEPQELLLWAAGGVYMSTLEFLKKSVENESTWFSAVLLGMIAASIDLRCGTRWPYMMLLFGFGLILACWQPRWTWRWTITLGLSLPALVLL